MAKFWERSKEYARQVSDEIIDLIKRGLAPWQKPWKPGESYTPENLSTGKRYTGGNSLYLMSRGIRRGFGDNRWGTYRQIAEAGGQVRKGERGTKVLFYTDGPANLNRDLRSAGRRSFSAPSRVDRSRLHRIARGSKRPAAFGHPLAPFDVVGARHAVPDARQPGPEVGHSRLCTYIWFPSSFGISKGAALG